MGKATQKSKSGANAGKLVVRIVIFTALAVALILALIDFNAKNSAVNTAEAWIASLVKADENEGELYQEDLDKLTQGSPSVAENITGAGQTVKNFTWSRILGDDYQVQVTFAKADKPFVTLIEPLW